MKNGLLLFIFFVVLANVPLPAQMDSAAFRHYHPLVSSGTIPAVFNESGYENYIRERQQVSANQSRSARLHEDQFYVFTNYFGDKLRFSGKVLVNDTLAQFVNKIADKLLASDPELRKKIHFYTLREPYMNAFTTDGGDIYVNIGLISRMENEAQLAFVLAHEIIHYKNHHVLNNYLHDLKVGQNQEVEHEQEDDQLVRAHNYSQKLELEADLLGFDLFVKAGYDPAAAITALNLLSLADYPFANARVDLSLFESPYFHIPGYYYPLADSAHRQPTRSDESKRSSSHPSVKERRDQLNELIAKNAVHGNTLHYFSAEGFSYIVTIAKFEEISLLSDNFRYMAAAYSGLCLLQKFPGNIYLRKEVLRAVFGYVMITNRRDDAKRYREYAESGEDYCEGGEFEPFRNYFQNAGIEGVTVSGIVCGMNIHRDAPADQGVIQMLKGLERELEVREQVKIVTLKTAADTADLFFPRKGNIAYVDADSAAAMSERAGTASLKNVFWKYAFIPYANDPLFEEIHHDAQQYGKEHELRPVVMEKETIKNERQASNRSDTLHMGISSLIVVSPEYYFIDYNEGDGLDVKKTMKKSELFNRAFAVADSALPMEVHLLAPGTRENSAGDFNLLMYSNTWIDQKTFYEDEEIIPMYTDSLQTLAARAHSEYISWSAMASFTRVRMQKALLYLGFFYIGVPRSLYFLFTPHCDSYFYSSLYNIHTGKKVEVERYMPGQHDDPARIQQNVYDYLYQLNRK